MTIAIHFGDNDFNTTFEKVALQLLSASIDGCSIGNWDKKNLLSVINSISYGIHRLHQPEKNLTQEEIQELIQGLQIKEENIFINEEATEFLETHVSNQETVVAVLDPYGSTVYII